MNQGSADILGNPAESKCRRQIQDVRWQSVGKAAHRRNFNESAGRGQRDVVVEGWVVTARGTATLVFLASIEDAVPCTDHRSRLQRVRQADARSKICLIPRNQIFA